MTTFKARFPVQEAVGVIGVRLDSGSRVLEIRGLRVNEDESVLDPHYQAGFGSEGTGDPEEVAAILEGWPRNEAFGVEVVFINSQ